MMRPLSLCFVLALALGLAGCARPKVERPPQKKSGFVASSDTFWLSEMLAQRLVISEEISWSRFQTGRGFSDDESDSGEAAAFVEHCVRLGLPAPDAHEFIKAQQAASRELESKLLLKWSKTPDSQKGPARDLQKVLIPQLEAVNAQMISVFVRMNGFPQGKALRKFLLDRLEARGVNRRVAEIAVKPFRPSHKKTVPETGEIPGIEPPQNQPLQSTLVPRVSM